MGPEGFKSEEEQAAAEEFELKRPDEKSHIQDKEKAFAMAMGEKGPRENAIEFRKLASDLRGVSSRHQEFPGIQNMLVELAEKYEKGAEEADKEGEKGAKAMGNSYDYLKEKGKL